MTGGAEVEQPASGGGGGVGGPPAPPEALYMYQFMALVIIVIINPQRMCEWYGSRSVCVCYCASCYIPVLYVENKVPLGFSW